MCAVAHLKSTAHQGLNNEEIAAALDAIEQK